VQSLLIRSLSASGQLGFVGAQGSGPVPATVLLTRIDRFGVDRGADGTFTARATMELTLLRDRDQRVIGTRVFTGTAPVARDDAAQIARAFQRIMDETLPNAVTWITQRA